MAFLSLNGAPALEALVCLPRVGVWHASLVVDTRSAPTGRVTLALGEDGLQLQGTVRRSGLYRDSARVQLVGGASGMATVLGAKFYRGVPLSIPLRDILEGAGEALAESVAPELLGQMLPAWTRPSGPAVSALDQLLAAAGADLVWRVLPGGAVWVGRETWPAADLSFRLLDDVAEEDFVEIWSEAPELVPGVTLQGRRVSRVEHRIEPSRTRTMAWFER